MTPLHRRHVARAGISAALAGGLLAAGALLAVPASAATDVPVLGTLSVDPGSGTVDDVPTFTTSGPCPSKAKYSRARILGPGFPTFGQNMSATAPGSTSKTTAFPVLSAYTLKDVAALTYPAVTYKGNYRVEVVCVGDLGKQLGLFAGTISFVNPVQWKTAAVSAPVKPGPTVSLPAVTTGPTSTATPSVAASGATSPSATPTAVPESASAADGTTAPAAESPTDLAAAPAASTDGGSPALLLLIGGLGGAAIAGGVAFAVGRRGGRAA